jgi:hypothetical protein
VRNLTRQHLFPTNFEKINVLRTIQVFSPAVSSSLKFLQENNDARFQGVDATAK